MEFRKRCAFSVGAGVLYALSFPCGFEIKYTGFLIFPGIFGLMYALRGLHGTRARGIGFLHGMVAYGLGLSWFWNLFNVFSVLLWMALAGFHALFAEMQSRAQRRNVTGWAFAIFTAINWSGWEWLRAEALAPRFPWMTPGLAMGPNWLLPWLGVYGVSFLVVLSMGCLIVKNWKTSLVLVALLCGSTFWRASVLQHNDPDLVTVGGVQFEGDGLENFLNRSKTLPKEVGYVVWPEYALPYDVRKTPQDWRKLQNLCKENQITLTIGTQDHLKETGKWKNIALTLDENGERGEHNKVHTVHLFRDGKAGKTALPISTQAGKVGTPVCFDCDYSDVTRRMTAAGAEMFIVPIMDATSWSKRQHEQHAMFFRIRACENARWMFVCSSSGVSQVIDPHGSVRARIPCMEEGVLIGKIRKETGLSFYTRYSWALPWGFLLCAICCWLWLLISRQEESVAD